MEIKSRWESGVFTSMEVKLLINFDSIDHIEVCDKKVMVVLFKELLWQKVRYFLLDEVQNIEGEMRR